MTNLAVNLWLNKGPSVLWRTNLAVNLQLNSMLVYNKCLYIIVNLIYTQEVFG